MRMSDKESSELIEHLQKASPSKTLHNQNGCDITMESESENNELNDVKDQVKYLNSKELKIKVGVIK